MTSFLRSDRSRAVSFWLFLVAAMVLAMVVVGGATRLTDSGLSITRWKPLSGTLPPLSPGDWAREFAGYQAIPQFRLLNPHMSLDQFKTIFWWEWSHRLLARVLGVVYLVPFAWFAVRREIPSRLWGQMGGITLICALEPLVGWWMVASGLADRVHVAPERLTLHLGIAMALLGALVWTALDAAAGSTRQPLPSPWGRRALGLVALVYVQVLLGALVAGNHAGRVYNDWPLFNGHLLPQDYAGAGFWATLAHSQGAVQLHHRLLAYLLAVVALMVGIGAARSRYLPPASKVLGVGVGVIVAAQVVLGIATLLAVAPIGLSMAHQFIAALLLCLSVAFAWRVRRA